MNLKDKLENEHSKALTARIAHYIGNDSSRMKELMAIVLGDDELLAQRAAWPMSYVFEAYPALIKPYYKKLISLLKNPNQHPAIYRNILRGMQHLEIPEKWQGELIDICFGFIKSEVAPLAVRAFAITTAANICKPYPELKNELLLILNQLNVEPQAPAVRVRTKSALKDLKRV